MTSCSLVYLLSAGLLALGAPAKKSPAPKSAGNGGQLLLPEVPAYESWRQSRPTAGPPPTPTLPTFESTSLTNGMTLLVTTADALPLVSFSVVTRGGSALDPPGRAGLTSLTYAMLKEGAGKKDALAFSDAVADLGANFGAASDRDHGTISISGLKRNASAMLGLLALAVQKPRFEGLDFERLKKQRIAALERNQGSPHGLAFEVFPGLVYGKKHPYGHAPTGTLLTVPKLTLAEVKAQHKDLFGPKTSALIATGDITLQEARALAVQHFGAWANTAASEPPPIVEPSAKPREAVFVIHKENAPQTMVLVGRPLFGRGHQDENTMKVLNGVYGGAFASRLNMNLREDKGYTYGAYSHAIHRTGAGAFVASGAIKQEVTAEGLREFFSELNRLTQVPPTPEEVGRVKAGLVRSLPGAFQTVGSIGSAAVSLFVHGLPLDHYASLGARYASVKETSVKKAVPQYLDPKLMQILLVGDQNKIIPKVKKLGLGPVRILDPRKP